MAERPRNRRHGHGDSRAGLGPASNSARKAALSRIWWSGSSLRKPAPPETEPPPPNHRPGSHGIPAPRFAATLSVSARLPSNSARHGPKPPSWPPSRVHASSVSRRTPNSSPARTPHRRGPDAPRHGSTRPTGSRRTPRPPRLATRPGAIAAVPFSTGADLTIVRSPYADADAEPPVALDQARLYLRNEEILAGELVSFDTEKVVFQSGITGRVEVPAKEVRAIDTGTSGRILEGFRDPEWEEIEEAAEDVTITPESATLRGGASEIPRSFSVTASASTPTGRKPTGP